MTFDGATSAVKFNQGRVIDKMEQMAQALDGEQTAATQLKRIKGGFCYALSLEWLRLAVLENENAEKGNPGINIGLEGANLLQTGDMAAYGYFKQIANNFISYAEKNSDIARQSNPDEFLSAPHNFWDIWEIDQFFIEMGSTQKLTPSGGIGSKDAAACGAMLAGTSANYFFIGFSLENATGQRVAGHRVAFCKRGSQLYFFDPNYGIYVVDDIDKFMQALVANYRTANYHVGFFYGTYA